MSSAFLKKPRVGQLKQMLKQDPTQLSILFYRCPSASLRKLLRRLRSHYAVEAGAAGREEPLTPGALRGHNLVVIGGPVRAPLGNAEIAATRAFVEAGGALLCLGEGADGGEVLGGGERPGRGGNEADDNEIDEEDPTNRSLDMNELLRPYGIRVNADVVVRAVFYKYLHPKEAFVSKGCVNDAFGELPMSLFSTLPLLTIVFLPSLDRKCCCAIAWAHPRSSDRPLFRKRR